MKAAIPLLCLATLFSAGCGSPVPDPPASTGDPSIPPTSPLPLGNHALSIDCSVQQRCHEPTVAVDAVGQLFATSFSSPEVFRIAANGTVSGLTAPFTGIEQTLQSSPEGVVWLTALDGAGVLASRWLGTGWSDPVSYAHAGARTGQFIDRQWLAFAPSGGGQMVYTVTERATTTAWAVPFDAAGAFGQAVLLAGFESRLENGPVGPPALDARGRLFVPMAGTLQPNVAPPVVESATSSNVVVVAVLASGSVVLETVHAAGPNDGVDRFWPAIALIDGDPVVTWSQRSGGLFTAQRQGDVWSAPALENDGRSPSRMPWIAAGPTGPVLAWYEEADGPGVLLAVAKAGGTVLAVSTPLDLGSEPADSLALQNFPTTDFAHIVVAGDRLAFPWHDRVSGTVTVSVVPLPAQP